MKVSASTQVGGFGGTFVRIDEDNASFIPWHINFTIDDAPWLVDGVIFQDIDHQEDDPPPQISRLVISQRPGGRPITPDIIRGLRLGAARDEAVRLVSTAMRRVGDNFYAVPDAAHPSTAKVAGARKGKRPSVEDLRAVVDIYRGVVKAGERTDRLVAVAEQTFLSTATVSRRLTAAKLQGLLGEEE